MKLIAITLPRFFSDESLRIEQMLESGEYWRVHIRKPDASENQVRQLILKIPQHLWSKLTIHYFPRLAIELGLGGIHLNSRLTEPPEGWQGLVSRSCHSIEELNLKADYRFLSPIFDNISKPGYHSRFNLDQLHGLIDCNTFALGGVTKDKLDILKQSGFGGAAMLGAAWQP